MIKLSLIFLTASLFLQISAQSIPSTYRQVFNYEVGDTFEYNYSSTNSPFQGMERWEYSMVVILGVHSDSSAVTYTIQYSDSGGTLWYGTPSHIVLNSGQDTTFLYYGTLDSSVFCHDPYYPSGFDSFTRFPYTDTFYLAPDMNYKKVDDHLEGSHNWSYIDTIYGDSIGFVEISSGFESDNSGENLSLIYYHKANGQKWGTHHPFGLTSSILNPDPESLAFRIYPNPASNQVEIAVDNSFIGCSVSLVDVAGKNISTYRIQSAITSIPISSYSSGIYFICANDGQRQVMRKLVLK